MTKVGLPLVLNFYLQILLFNIQKLIKNIVFDILEERFENTKN